MTSGAESVQVLKPGDGNQALYMYALRKLIGGGNGFHGSAPGLFPFPSIPCLTPTNDIKGATFDVLGLFSRQSREFGDGLLFTMGNVRPWIS